MWEMRFFSPDPPALAQDPSSALGCAALLLHDDDVYLLGAAAVSNVKLRHRSGTAKLKVRVQRTADGAELWREVFEQRLPIAEALVVRLAEALQVDPARLRPLERAATSEDALAGLAPDDEALRLVPVTKRRRLFRSAGASVEIALVTFPAGVRHSVCLESDSLERVRELRRALLPACPLPPEDYVAACARLGAARPQPAAE